MYGPSGGSRQNFDQVLSQENLAKTEAFVHFHSNLESLTGFQKPCDPVWIRHWDPAGFIREMFINGGQMLTQSSLAMANSIKNKRSTPLQWNQIYIQTLKMVECESYLTTCTEAFFWSLL